MNLDREELFFGLFSKQKYIEKHFSFFGTGDGHGTGGFETNNENAEDSGTKNDGNNDNDPDVSNPDSEDDDPHNPEAEQGVKDLFNNNNDNDDNDYPDDIEKEFQNNNSSINNFDPSDPFGSIMREALKQRGYDPDEFGVYDDGVYNTTVSIVGINFTYDTHIYRNGKEYGFAAELAADVSEGFFDSSIHEDTAVVIDATAKAVGIGISLSALPVTGAMLSSGIVGLQIAGALSLTSTFADIKDLAEFFGEHFPGSQVSVELAMENHSSAGELTNLTYKAYIKDQQEQKNKINQLALILGGEYGKYMAGGSIYNGVFAGGNYFDASQSPDLGFSVGESYIMSEHAKRIHIPYVRFLPKNIAGVDGFSVLY
ncbi:MAG: hypothetical protein CR967_04590 [Proteobacteria bacterium]|nr:MAG: hypothetical protein CR967_04590 [Pseudomonadota bacterium]